MTFSFNPNLPNPPDDPADDVPGMQVNSTSIAGIIGVDHVPFNVLGGGQHAQVTFNANNIPTPPVSPPVLFTNNPGGAPLNYPQLYYYSGNATQSSTQYVSGGAGSVLLLGGIIMKWFTVNVNGTGGTFTYAGAGISDFPNNVYNAQLSVGTLNISVAVSSLTTSQIVIGKSPSAAPAVGVFVLLIGS